VPDREQVSEELQSVTEVDKDSIAGRHALALIAPDPGNDLAVDLSTIPPTATDRFRETSDLQVKKNSSTPFEQSTLTINNQGVDKQDSYSRLSPEVNDFKDVLDWES
jgi:hypothetical protein